MRYRGHTLRRTDANHNRTSCHIRQYSWWPTFWTSRWIYRLKFNCTYASVRRSDDIHLHATTDINVSDQHAIVTDEENAAAAERQRSINQQMKKFAKMLTLSIVYSSNIGGTATLTGTPTNLIITDAANRSVPFLITIIANISHLEARKFSQRMPNCHRNHGFCGGKLRFSWR